MAYHQAHASEMPAPGRAAIFQKEYLDKGSAGLKAFVKARIKSATELTKATHRYRKYYASVEASTLHVESEVIQTRIRRSFDQLETLYPSARFVDVFFLIGKMSTGGTISDERLLIGTELFSRTEDSPTDELGVWHKQVTRSIEDIPIIVAHELIHIQQSYLGREKALLGQAITEGSADFIGEKITGAHINGHIHTYANPMEQQIWEAFQSEMNGKDFSRWLYNAGNVEERPADLGYYVGYKICESFYERSSDKQKAIADILTINDFEAFLEESGYGAKFSEDKE